ncbi:MAG: hypothetical protein ACK5M3_18290 [Dysgonomonas sp.]
MKKIILIIIFISISILGKAQCDLPYKPLSEFNKDTTAFMIYNFMDRKDCYKGKTLKEVTKDLGIPIKDYTRGSISRGALFGYIYIYIYDDITVRGLWDSKKDDNVIRIFWETPINVLHSDYKRLIGIKWDEGAYDYLKDMKIKELRVSISSYSKYYEKYKEKETKSHDPNKRREGDW